MIHSLEKIAQYRYLDPNKLKDYATKYRKGLLTDCGAVTSWDVDALVQGYIEFVGQFEYESDRLAIIARR